MTTSGFFVCKLNHHLFFPPSVLTRVILSCCSLFTIFPTMVTVILTIDFNLPSVDSLFHFYFLFVSHTPHPFVCPRVCLCRVSCVFPFTSWKSEGSPKWPGPSAVCSTWPRHDTPSPRQPPQRHHQPHLDPKSPM